jgi:uncharacterized membrane protein (DUF4010 family)
MHPPTLWLGSWGKAAMDPEGIIHFQPNLVAIRLAVALAIGMLVGFERESASKDAGIRTFGLVAMLAAVSVMVSPGFGLAAFGGVIVLIALLNLRSMTAYHALEITTAAALLVTYALGALVGLGHTFTPVAGAILMTLLLAWKLELRRFAGGVTMEELRSAVLLGLIGLVIHPILPDRFIDPWQLLNPREAWVTVVVIAGIAFVNYVLLRLYGTRGLSWTAFLGGLVNNRAAIAELMNVVDGARIVGIVLFATLAMFLRNICLLALFAPRALTVALGPLLAMAGMCVLVPARKGEAEPGKDLGLASPISLRRVLFYGGLFLVIQVLSTLAERHLGVRGFLAASWFAGMASSASATAAAANLGASHKIAPALAGTATVVASMASLVTNLPLIFRRVPRPTFTKVGLWTALQVAIGLGVLTGQRFLPIH